MPDRHGWNSWEDYQEQHRWRVDSHPFVNAHSLAWREDRGVNGSPVFILDGAIFADRGVAITDHVWTIAEIVAVIEANDKPAAKRGHYKPRQPKPTPG